MPELAFVVFDENSKKGNPGLITRSGMLRTYVGFSLFHMFRRRKFRAGILEFELDAGTGTQILLIRLPFPPSWLPFLNRQLMERYILKVCAQKDCLRCYLPEFCRSPGFLDGHAEGENTCILVFKSLLIPVLEEIYLKNGLRLDNLNTVLIHGESTNELKIMVSQLEPFVRHLNIASSSKEAVEAELADICMESGITVFVGGDLKSMLKNANLIINLGEVSVPPNIRVRQEPVVIHFSGTQNALVHGECTFISGVDFIFPAVSYEAFGEDINKNYSKQELSQILIESKAGLLNGGIYNETTAAMILGIFKSSGCKITGFHGRRGTLKVENILKALRLY